MTTEQVTVDRPWLFRRVEPGAARVVDRVTGRDAGYVVKHYYGWGAYTHAKHRVNTVDYQTRVQAGQAAWNAS